MLRTEKRLTVGYQREFPLSTLYIPAREGDVGHDLRVVITEQSKLEKLLSKWMKKTVVVVWPLWGTRTIRSGIRLQLPHQLWAWIRPRSSTSRMKMEILGGVIDPGFRGELLTVVHNFGPVPRVIHDGQRLAQVIFFKAQRPELEEVTVIEQSDRGTAGFGSTGK